MASLLATLTAGAALAAAASAEPVWQFEGEPLVGSETVTAVSTESNLELSGLTTSCEATAELTVFNEAEEGRATFDEVSLANCDTDGVCTVEEATAEGLPWSAGTTTFGEDAFLVTDDFDEEIAYGSELCAVEGWTFPYAGTAAAVFDNASSTLEYSSSSGSSITTFGGTEVVYDADFDVEATGAHEGEALTLE